MITAVLIEDEKATVELMREAIKDSEEDIDLVVFSSGESALSYLRGPEKLPHLVLLDLNLPGKNGLEVLKELKQSSLKTLPVIVITNSQSPNDVIQAYTSQCNAYVRKPMGFDAIVEMVQRTGKFWFEIATLPEVEN